MLAHIPPRFFSDFTLPQCDEGTSLTECRKPGDYEFYVRWLSNYLHTTEIPLSPAQAVWVRGRKPESVIFACSDAFGYAVDTLDDLNSVIDSGGTYTSHRAYMLELWDDCEEDAREIQTFEEWMDLSESTFERLRIERMQEKETGQTWTHADIPFRSLLAWALRQMPDPEERFRQMDWFFRNFSGNAGK